MLHVLCTASSPYNNHPVSSSYLLGHAEYKILKNGRGCEIFARGKPSTMDWQNKNSLARCSLLNNFLHRGSVQSSKEAAGVLWSPRLILHPQQSRRSFCDQSQTEFITAFFAVTAPMAGAVQSGSSLDCAAPDSERCISRRFTKSLQEGCASDAYGCHPSEELYASTELDNHSHNFLERSSIDEALPECSSLSKQREHCLRPRTSLLVGS